MSFVAPILAFFCAALVLAGVKLSLARAVWVEIRCGTGPSRSCGTIFRHDRSTSVERAGCRATILALPWL